MPLRFWLLWVLGLVRFANAQPIITTFAGSDYRFDGDGKRAIQAPLGRIAAVAVDNQGRVYVADPDNHMVMRFTPNGTLNVIAGNGIAGYSGDGGPATSASLSGPAALAFDSAGNLYIADYNNSVIRKVTPDGTISTFSGGGTGYVDGPAATARYYFYYYPALAFDSSGALYIADHNNDRIRKLSNDGQVTTIAGTGQGGFSGDGGPAISAAIHGPSGIAVDRNGNVYFSDSGNVRVRKISNGVITTVAGNGVGSNFRDGPGTTVSLASPGGLALDAAGNLYIADSYQTGASRVRRLSTAGNLTTVAGTGPLGFSGDGGSATAASLNQPSAVAIDSAGNLYIADSGNGRVRRVNSFGAISTAAGNGGFGAAGDGGPAVNASFKQPVAIAVDSTRNTYVVDKSGQRIRKIDPSGIITTLAGTGEAGFTGDGGPAVNASLNAPAGIATDSSGNVYIADTGNARIRKITPDGTITTFAGGGASTADGVRATTASIPGPSYIAVDGAGNVYFVNSGPGTVRKISTDGIVTTVAGGGRSAADGIPASTALISPQALTVDADGTIYVVDGNGGSRVRKVSTSGIITTAAGRSSTGCGGDGGPATAATISSAIFGLAVDPAGNLYISDSNCNKVRRVSASGVISTFAGDGREKLAGDGGPADVASLDPQGIALDSDGNVYIADTANSRIRRVLTVAAAFGTSPGALAFSASSGGAPPPLQNLALTGTFAGPPFQVNLATSDGNAWLATNALGGNLPTVLQVYADPTGLDPGAYQGTITIGVAGSDPPQRTVPVTFTVGQTLPPTGSVDPSSLSFSLATGGGPVTRQINVSNSGGGSLSFTVSATANSGGAWLAISPASGTATPSSPASITVIADPSKLGVGTYTGTVSINLPSGIVRVPVSATVTTGRQTILLSQTGLTFTAVAGGGVVPAQTVGVLNIGQGQMSWTARATTLAGGASWLSASPASGSTDAASLSVPLVTVNVDQTGLAAGSYYGQVQISAGGADNTPQVITVVLNVLPAGSDPGPLIRPTGLIFTTPFGGNPGAQNVLISNLSASTANYISGRLSDQPGNLFQHQPVQASIAPNTPVSITVQPTLAGADPQVYRGTLTLQFSSGTAQTVSLLFVVAGGGSIGSSDRSSRAAAGCVPTRLVPLFTSLGYGFSVAAAWPAPVEIRVVDDCGNPVVDGAVVATFSNGDAPLSLASLKDGRWTATWLPVNRSQPQITLTVKASIPGAGLSGTAQVTGGLTAGANAPVISSGSVVNAASLEQQAPLAPGTLITVFGSALADAPATAAGYPLPVQLGGAAILMAGRSLPLLNVAPGVVNAQIPYDLPVNTRHQLVLQHGAAIATSPEAITIASAQPAIFTNDRSGSGQGLIYKVIPGADPALADASNPLQPGDQILIRCTGLGAVSPALQEGAAASNSPPATVNAVTLTIGGVSADVASAGLAPGLAGVYQVQAKVPSGIPPGGPAPFILTVAGQSSYPVTAVMQ